MRADQPRVCGEKGEQTARPHYHMGSPPHMRGKGERRSNACSIPGITPAYAGKRRWCVPHRSRSGDHPRMCGEKYLSAQERRIHKGSPPRMRGKGVNPRNKRVTVGITPAHAGKRRARRGAGLWSQDHPRTCGEKWDAHPRWGYSLGSPPHMRGKGIQQREDWTTRRITPAHAGKSCPKS